MVSHQPLRERRTRRRRNTSPLPEPTAATAARLAAAPALGVPATDRVGHSVSDDCHVVAVVEVDSSPSGLETQAPTTLDDGEGVVAVTEADGSPPAIDNEASAGGPTESNGSSPPIDEDIVETTAKAPPLHAPSLASGPQVSNAQETCQQPDVGAPVVEEEVPSVESPTLMRFELDPMEQSVTTKPQQAAATDVTPPCNEPVDEAKRAENIEQAAASPDSPLVWVPAEMALPSEPPNSSGVNPTGMITYSRRRGTQTQAHPPSSEQSPMPSVAATEFLARVTKTLPASLPTPAPPQRRRRQVAVSTHAPRRSRRVARLPPEIDVQATTTVCRRLGFVDNASKVTPSKKDKYTKFFEKPLSKQHVAALAALMGKEIPPSSPVLSQEVVVSA